MQRIPLLLSGNPKTIFGRGGPIVPVPAGKWRVMFDGVTNSLIHIRYNSPQLPAQMINTFSIHDGEDFVLEQPQYLSVRIAELGTEGSINVYLKEVK